MAGLAEGTGAAGPAAGAGAELARFRALVEHAPDAVVIHDLATGRWVLVNRAAEELFGMDRAELLRAGGPVALSPPVQPDGRPSKAAAQEYIARALAGERPRFEWVHRRADGTDVPCEVRLLRLPDPDRQLVRGSIVDVTERRAAEAARAEALAEQVGRRAAEAAVTRLQATLAGLNAVVWERDPRTLRLTFVNERAEEVLGYPAAQWLAEEGLWARILHPDDRDAVLAGVRAEVDSGAVDFSLAYRVRAADGRWVWLQHLGHVARDETGTARTLHAVLFDVTDARRREQAADLLAAAGRALSAPGSAIERLSAVATLTAGVLGDRATIWLRGTDGRYRPVAAAPPQVAPQVLGLAPVAPPSWLEAAYQAGRPFAVADVDEELMRASAAGDGAQFRALAALRSRSMLAVPLLADGQLVGLLTVLTGEPRQRSDAELALAGELGQRIAGMVAAERVATRQRQLHEVTVALSGAGSVAEAAGELATGLRRILGATVVGVCRLDPDGALHLVHAVGYPADRAARFDAVRLDEPLPFAEAARTGRPVWLPTRQAWSDRYPQSAAQLLPETQASVALPLMAGGRLLGTVAASFPEPRLFEPDERAFLLALADQAAVAFERARLADVRREMADTLQRSLLPGAVPQPDRLAVAARYLPAVAGTAAGGDWFDVLPLRDGRVAVAVGDVVGHGAPAAATMGQLRSSLAALLFAGCTPAPALELLDGLSARIAGARVTTVACLLLDPATGELTYSRAGHPPPLVTDRSTSVFLDGGLGPALGLPGTGRRTEAVTTLTTGATLLLFTDGLIEARDADLDRGLARLAAAVDACRTAPVDALVDGVLTAMVAGTAHDDDIALVALRPLPAPLDLRLPADPTQLGRLRRAVEAWATDAALPVDAAEDLQLAVGEAAANAVEHAYRAAGTAGQVRLELTAERGGGVGATVTDTGSWRPPPADPGFRGRGLQIIEALATDVDLDHRPNGTALRFRLPPARPQPAARQPVTATRRAEPAQLRVTDADGRRCLELVGDLDLIGVEAVRGPLLAELTAGRPVVLDLTRLGYVTSVGAGLLLEAAQTAAGDLQILPPAAGPARRLLDLTGLTGVLHRGAHSRLTR